MDQIESFKEGQYCFIFTKNRTKLKLKTNIWTRLNHFDMWHNCGVTHVKKFKKKEKYKKIQKNQKMTHGVDFNTVWSKLTARTKLNHF